MKTGGLNAGAGMKKGDVFRYGEFVGSISGAAAAGSGQGGNGEAAGVKA